MRLLMAGLMAAVAFGAPCTTGSVECTERVPVGPAGRYAVVYRSFPLTATNASIERAVIVVHGQVRNADNYFESVMAGAFLGRALGSTLVVSPRFASRDGNCKDRLEEGEISWGCRGAQRWAVGGDAADAEGVAAFDLADRLIEMFARKDVFPNLKSIVVTGHSAGGQFVNRYAAASRVEARVPVKYVVSNPSSYLYLDATREFAEGTGKSCGSYNEWGYGLDKRAGYAKRVSDEDLRARTAARDVTYLLGELDTIPVEGFDASCAAMAQGKSRLERGMTYWKYVNQQFGAKHRLEIVPACGHNGRCMYTSEVGVRVVFH